MTGKQLTELTQKSGSAKPWKLARTLKGKLPGSDQYVRLPSWDDPAP